MGLRLLLAIGGLSFSIATVADSAVDEERCSSEECALNLLQRRAGKRTEAADVAVSNGTASTTWQPTRLRVTNRCGSQDMWIAHMYGATVGSDPQDVRLTPGASHDFNILDGTSSARFWPKLGCDAHGEGCHIGQSGGPGQSCPADGCGPPVDTKFEASFGAVSATCDTSRGLVSGCDWLDVSLVDGFTTPFKVELDGDCGGRRTIDCSGLELSQCPANLHVRHPSGGAAAGCYSPCAQKTYSHWGNDDGRNHPDDDAAKMWCCPTPPVSVAQCKAGPVASSEYVNMVHRHCPGVYGYAYDDAEGLRVCKSGVKYHVSFYCPS